MKFIEVQLDGFGKLVGPHFEFAPGFNLIYGPNEAGKSTLQQALLALLYGFYDRGRVTREKTAAMSQFQPWASEAVFRASLTYGLDNGALFHVQRGFGTRPTTRLLKLPDRVDVSTEYESESHGRLFFADVQIGMSKEVFEHTCFVRQDELRALETSANAITETLMRLSTSASQNTTASQALRRLQEAVKEQVGTERARLAPLPQAKVRLLQLEGERSATLQARRDLLVSLAELRRLDDELARQTLEGQRWSYLEMLARRALIQQQLTTYTDTSDEDPVDVEVTRWARWADFPAQLADEVADLNAQHRLLRVEYERLRPDLAQAQKELTELDSQIATAQARVNDLADVRQVRVEQRPDIERLARTWHEAKATLERAEANYTEAQQAFKAAQERLREQKEALGLLSKRDLGALADLKQQWRSAASAVDEAVRVETAAKGEWARVGMSEAQYLKLESTVQAIRSGAQPAPAPRSGCGALFGGGSGGSRNETASEVTIYTQIQPIYVNLTRAVAGAERARSALASVQGGITRRLGLGDVGKVDEALFADAEQRLTAYQRASAMVEQQKIDLARPQEQWRVAQAQAQRARDALQSQLAPVGLRQKDVDAAVQAYLSQCDRRVELGRVEDDLQRLKLQANAPRAVVKTGKDKEKALRQLEQQLCGVLQQAAIECTPDTLGQGLAQFETGLNSYRRWVEAKAVQEVAKRSPRGVLDAASRAQLEIEQAKLDQEITRTQSEHPAWAELKATQAVDEYADQARWAEQAIVQAREAYRRCQDSVQQAMTQLRHPAEIDEEIALLQAEIGSLECYRNSLTLAQTELAQATHEFQSVFAPRLAQVMGEALRQITNGRYSSVQVEPKTLAVMLTTPETGRSVGVELLSTGTQDLVYLMLRFALARLMSRTDEKLPLLLDDPLVHYDQERQERALQFLDDVGGETQVLFFTKDDWAKQWFEQRHANSTRNKLHVLRLEKLASSAASITSRNSPGGALG